MKFQYSLRELFLLTTLVCCIVGMFPAYKYGRYCGASKVFYEIGGRHYNYGKYALVPLYVDGKPSAVLWIDQNIPLGEKRHIMIRIAHSGAHWELVDGPVDTKGVIFSENDDYLQELLK